VVMSVERIKESEWSRVLKECRFGLNFYDAIIRIRKCSDCVFVHFIGANLCVRNTQVVGLCILN